MLSMRMPFPAVPCLIWLPVGSAEDAYGNVTYSYADQPDIETTCVYAPGDTAPETSDEIADGRPYGDRLRVTFFLPKTVCADLRGALIQCLPLDDATLASMLFRVEGVPTSYPRDAVPGDYSWSVRGVEHLG